MAYACNRFPQGGFFRLRGVADADAGRQQHADERNVKEQVAGLAQVAAFGRNRHLGTAALRRLNSLNLGSVALGAQQFVRLEDRALGERLTLFGGGARVRNALLGITRHALQTRRGARWLAPQRLPVVRDAWQHAADQ